MSANDQDAVDVARRAVEIQVLLASLAESEESVSLLQRQSVVFAGNMEEEEEEPCSEEAATQGMAARPRPLHSAAQHDTEDDEDNDGGFMMTQGVAAAPRPLAPTVEPDEEAATQGIAAAPRRLLDAAAAPFVVTAARAGPRKRKSVRVAFTGLRDGQELERLRSIVTALNGTLEDPRVLSAQVTHVVCAPSVGGRPTALSIYAALSRKVLVSPAWLDLSQRQGDFVELGATPALGTADGDAAAVAEASLLTPPPPIPQPPPPSRSESGSGGTSRDGSPYHAHGRTLEAVAGIENPFDGRPVHLTAGFQASHAQDKTVSALLFQDAPLLRRAKVIGPEALSAQRDLVVVFAAEAEVPIWAAAGLAIDVFTWESFLERLVPGHDAKRRTGAARGLPAGGLRKRAREAYS